MNRFRIDMAYDGTAYAGWQIQPNGPTVQQSVEEALLSLASERTKVHASGRTDQGVHARRQVAHFDLHRPLAPESLKRGLNALLPPDIRVLRVAAAAIDFHARKSAVAKEYRYFVVNAPVLPPWIRNYRAHVSDALNLADMRRAASHLVGRHDFAAFSANPDRPVESTTRTIFDLAVRKRGSEIVIAVRGDGFLYRMVRSLAGYLLRVGDGAEDPAGAAGILASRVRTARVPTAPAQGLFLWNVWYGPGILRAHANSDHALSSGRGRGES
jgi:tRNA pseudouridine38-40 synthase